MKIQSPRSFLARLAIRRLLRERRALPLTVATLAVALLTPPPSTRGADVSHTIASGASGNISDSAQYTAGGAPGSTTAGDILQDLATSSPGAFTLTVDIPVTIGTIKLNAGGNHTGTFNAGAGAFTLDNTGGTTANSFGNLNASIAETANAGLLTIGANIIAANANLDIGSTQVGTVSITGNITSSNTNGTTLNLRQNATQTSSTITDLISGSIGASGSAIAINNLSSGGGGNTKDIFLLSGGIGGNVGTGAAVTITNAATGSSPFNISGALGATVSSITQNSAASTMTISGANTSFVGTTSIQAGTLAVSSATGLGNSAVTLSNVSGATLNVTTATSIGSLAGSGTTGGNVTAAATLTTGGDGTSTTYSGTISGAGGLTKLGTGTFTLNGTNTYSGTTAVNAGTLKLDFTTTNSPTTNILGNTTAGALSLGGGTLQILGASGGSTQTFASTAIAAGASVITAAPTSGGTNPTVALNAIALSAGAAIQFVGPATINGSGNVAATAAFTTTTAGSTATNAGGILLGSSGNAYATVGLYDWASTNTTAGAAGTSPYTIVGGSQVSGFYTVLANNANPGTSSAANLDFTAQQTPALGGTNNIRFSTGTQTASTIRFNSGHAPYATVKSGTYFQTAGVLVTPTLGSVNTAIDGLRLTSTSTQIVQNNTGAVFVVGNGNGSGPFFSNSNNTAEAVVKSGAGTWAIDPSSNAFPINYLNSSNALTTTSNYYNYGANSYSGTYGAFYFDGGVSLFNSAGVFGNPTSASTTAGGGGTINLNGGTLMNQTNDVNLVYPGISGTPNRAVFVGSNGGGLAAETAHTLTVGGVISGAGGLSIGIPASTANGNVAGLVPGTGGTTANAAIYAAGTVVLTGGNSYTGVTTLNTGTLNINGQFALGGAVYGGLTFNGGTLQYVTSLATGTNGTGDISATSTGIAKPVTVGANGGAIDLNGNAITFANSIGNNGTGALTIKSSTTGGSLTLAAPITYTGTTNITGAGLILSTGNLNTSPTVSVTAAGALTLQNATALSDAGTLSLVSGTALNLNAAAGTSEVISSLILDGTTEAPGTYTAAQLMALDNNIAFSSSLGEMLTIAPVPEPGTCLAGALLAGVAGWSLRRRFVGDKIAAAI